MANLPQPKFRSLLCMALLTLLTLAAFAPAFRCGFINLDDADYVWKNPHLPLGFTWANVHWALTEPTVCLWHPLSMLSFLLDYQWFGLNPAGYHVENVLFHTASTVLLFIMLRQMTGALWRSALAAALFAIHPLRVESVVWVSERKDVLAMFFGLLTLWAYVSYARRPGVVRYGLVVMAFVLSLLAKPMLVPLPLVLLLLDYWPLRRWQPDETPRLAAANIPSIATPSASNEAIMARPIGWLLLEKLPLLCLAAWDVHAIGAGDVAATIAGPSQAAQLIPGAGAMPTLAARLANIPIAYVRYLWKTVWFGNLAIFYPFSHWPRWQVIGATALLLGITLLVLRSWRTRPWLAVGWLWFVGTLAPASGIMPIGFGSALADHYSYFPAIGLILMAVWSLPAALFAVRRTVAVAALSAVLATMLLFTWIQIGYWKDTVSILRHSVAVTTNNELCMYHLGDALIEQQDYQGAVAVLRDALAVEPLDLSARFSLVHALDRAGQFAPAEREVEIGIGLIPANLPAKLGPQDLGYDFPPESRPNTMRQRVALIAHAIESQDHYNRGVVLHQEADRRSAPHAAAIAEYQETVRLDPRLFMAYGNMGTAMLADGDLTGAIAAYRRGLAINPRQDEVYYALAWALCKTHQRAEAQRLVQQLQPLSVMLARRLQQLIDTTPEQ